MPFFAACGTATSSNGASSSVSCAEGNETSVGSGSEDETAACANIAIFENLQSNDALVSTTRTVAEAIATGLSNALTRANVVTSSDSQAATTYAAWTQLMGGDDAGDLALAVASAFSNADINVIPTISGNLEGTVAMRLSAIDRESGALITTISFSGTATELGAGAVNYGTALAEAVKKARVCLTLSPARAVIDFDDSSKRTQTFTAGIKDLKNQPLDSGEVSFELDFAEWGSLSAESDDISGGEASTVFTMTERYHNGITATYAGEFKTQTKKSDILPQCGWILSITGSKTFTLDHASPAAFYALFGDGAWITLLGSSSLEGKIPLNVLKNEGLVYGSGWMTEDHTSTGEIYIPLRSVTEPDVIVGECDAGGTISGNASGTWIITGTSSGSSPSIQITFEGMAMGESPVGQSVMGQCNAGGLSTSGSSRTSFGVMSELPGTTMPLTAGAETTVTGTGSFFEEGYTYTLTLQLATP